MLIDKHQRRLIGEAIVQGYLKHPQTEEELEWAHDNAIAMIEEEPWATPAQSVQSPPDEQSSAGP